VITLLLPPPLADTPLREIAKAVKLFKFKDPEYSELEADAGMRRFLIWEKGKGPEAPTP
jgi:hypothetical protein